MMNSQMDEPEKSEEVEDKFADSSEANHLDIEIDWNNKCLTKLPELTKSQTFITVLNLSGNLLKCNIDWLIHLKRLRSLNLSSNFLTEIVGVCGSVETLENVNLSNNELKKLPEWVLLLEKVKFLNLGFNPISKDFHCHLSTAKWAKSVEICHLESMNLVSIPECLHNASNLKELYLGNLITCQKSQNCFWMVAESLPSSLEILELSHIKLASLTCKWETLKNLKELRISGNDLFWPSDEFTLLSKLEICDMSSSGIILLPKNMGFLQNLQFIHLAFNKLAVVPASFEILSHLSHLDLYNNNIESIECDLTKVPKLLKCDLWMNHVNPLDYLPNHKSLCERLRDELKIEEKKNRCCEQAQPVVVEEGGEGSHKEFHYSDDSDEDSSSSISSIIDTGKVPVNSNETSGIEVSWDDDAYSDPDLEELRREFVPSIVAQSINLDDQHLFCPADLHTSTHARRPNNFPIIKGQFDDESDEN